METCRGIEYLQPSEPLKGQKGLQTPASSSKIETKERTGKLCLISTNKKHKILDFAEKNFQNKEVCHYLTSDVGVLQLLNGLEHKIKTFTFDDYCVIFIGQTDFHETQQYYKIVTRMRNILQNLQHTNIILCAPTFKLGYNMLMNHRIELFNNLLYLDNCTHEYAYLFDSNAYLAYNKSMFNMMTRQINKNGVKCIFNNLQEYIVNWNSDTDLKGGEELFR